MPHFSEEQLKELETTFGLKRTIETLPVKDGVVAKGDMVWWRGDYGLEYVKADDHQGCWTNIRRYPHVYSLAKPRIKITYLD